jgi:hypothetical protein
MGRPTSRVTKVGVSGPLAGFADAYAVELRRRGYTLLTSVNELRQVGRFSRWLEAGGLSAADVSGALVEEFLVWQRAGGRHRGEWSRPGLLCLLDVLRGLGVLADAPSALNSPTDLLLSRFGRYLLTERGLTSGTVDGYVANASRFLEGWCLAVSSPR